MTSTTLLDRSRAPGRRERAWRNQLFVLPAVLVVAATTLYPLFYNLQLSTYDAPLTRFLNGDITPVGAANYLEQLRSPVMWQALGTSLIYTCATIVLMFVGGLALAIFFNRDFPGRNLLRAALFLPYVLPSVVAANVWRWLLDGTFGLLNHVLSVLHLIDEPIFWLGRPGTALVAVILATGWTMIPFAMLLLVAGLQSVPGDILEAAELDGAGPVRRFVKITLPLLVPVGLVVALLGFIYTFKTFDTIFIMTKGGPGDATTTLPILAYNSAFVNFDLGQGAALNTLLLVIPVVLALVYFRAVGREQVS